MRFIEITEQVPNKERTKKAPRTRYINPETIAYIEDTKEGECIAYFIASAGGHLAGVEFEMDAKQLAAAWPGSDAESHRLG